VSRVRRLPVLLRLSLILSAVISTGCVDRFLVIESTPPGARVLLDGRDRGTTPLRLSYVHDGTFRVRLEMEGHESVTDEIVTCTATDAVPGIDFFAENLLPRRISRATVRRYDLPPLKRYSDEEFEALLKRADAFRERTGREVAEPGTPPRSRPPTPAPAPASVPGAPAGR
jgi:hypothetical protein